MSSIEEQYILSDRCVVDEFLSRCLQALELCAEPEQMQQLMDSLAAFGLRLAKLKDNRSLLREEFTWFYCGGTLHVVENGKALDASASWKAKAAMIKQVFGAAVFVANQFAALCTDVFSAFGDEDGLFLRLVDCVADIFRGDEAVCNLLVPALKERVLQKCDVDAFMGPLFADITVEANRAEIVALWSEVAGFAEPSDGVLTRILSRGVADTMRP